MKKRGRVYNRIFNPKEWEEVCKYNKNLLEDWLLELRSKKVKESTIKQYKNDVRILFIYILREHDNKPIYKLKKKQFRNYSLWLSEELNLSNDRKNVRLELLLI